MLFIKKNEKPSGTDLAGYKITRVFSDKTVKELSQGEKQILRYIAVLRQGKVAMGDLAGTIESPSNQLKVFRQQLVEAKVALSNLFMGTFANILPYANALLMVIKEVSYAIASMFGIELTDYNTSISSGKDAMEDLGGSIDNATGKAKELKRQFLSFDQVHNINENKDSGGAGSAISGGIDQRLLDAINSYDNGMSKVRMKATQIRDRIMEWLGFTKEIDKETGNVYFKFNGSNTTMSKILKSLKGIGEYGTKAIKNVFDIIKKDFDNGLFGSALVLIFQTIEKILKFIAQNKDAANIIAKLVEMFIIWKTVIQPLQLLFDKLKTSLTDFMVNFSKTSNTIQGKVGAWALLAASIMNLANTIKNGSDMINRAHESTEKAGRKYINSLNEMKTTAYESASAELALMENHQKLVKELEGLIDSNGKVKEGYEQRANTILTILNKAYDTEYKLVGNVITQNGKIIKSYDNIKNNIGNMIKEKKAELMLRAYEDEYVKALKNRKQITEELEKKQRIYNQTEDEYNYLIEHGSTLDMFRANELYKSMQRQKKGLDDLKVSYGENSKDIAAYDNLLEGSIEGNMGKVNAAFDYYGLSQDELITDGQGKVVKYNEIVGESFDETSTDMKKSAESSSLATQKYFGSAYENIKFKLQQLAKQKITVAVDLSLTGKIKGATNQAKEILKQIGIKTNAQGGVYNNGSWSSIPQYASGGIPNRGSMFIAGEAGAEIVGNINGRTEVLNKSQIASAIYSAVKSAMSETGGKDAIEIYAHTDEGVVIDRINRKTKQTGVCPIEMPLG